MDTDHITNENLMSTDFARTEKARFLQSITNSKRTKEVFLAPGVSARGVWMTDVSAMDRRSVKAQLAGRGDHRAAWWDLNCLIHRLLKPRASLEHVMYAFHTRHHAITIAKLELADDFWCTVRIIKQHGPIAGLRCAIRQLQQPKGDRHESPKK
ncbi:hypothetical protein SAMN04515620_12665 [Collimonas sp. OK607]|uniref:hypothetical protein n=1 Tax=Collimonas sp. OK607 TaxID=1798194 RepID=UPI0008EB98CF|nr:hypothetical protein [Collimonas sp. OK607]SFB21475.1 hypothetical protein SAMN04515620_12665 [Collimonas sp. OK607]